jgi:hypothetical protein
MLNNWLIKLMAFAHNVTQTKTLSARKIPSNNVYFPLEDNI